MAKTKTEKTVVENINTPGKTSKVDAAKYQAMKEALLTVIPTEKPGITHQEMVEKVKPHLPEALFPNGAKAGWWSKTVQLDLEAKSIIVRTSTKPIAWYRK